jgi:hypothetical protein
MTTRYGLDRDSFDAFLGDAFAVQESGLDRESLASLVEIQKFIANEQFDLNETIQMIAQHVLTLSSADGVAVALLDGDSLVYLAGAGIAAKDVGHHIGAVLKVSAVQDARHEILRVDNAETDMRIEAAICRQFDASSMLMLPICQDHVLMGILQVLFRHAHSFLDREIHVCRLMADALEDAISRRKQPGIRPKTLGSDEQIPHARHGNLQQRVQCAANLTGESTTPLGTVERPAFRGFHSTNKRDHSATVLSRQSQSSRAVVKRRRDHLWANLTTSFEPQGKPGWSTDLWHLGVALTAAVFLAAMVWLWNVGPRSSSTTFGVPTFRDKGESGINQPVSVNREPNPHDHALREGTRSAAAFNRVQVSSNEVDYISEDVTIRRFTTGPANPQTRKGVKEVNFGEDVTVRYFATTAPIVQPSSLESKPGHNTPALVKK